MRKPFEKLVRQLIRDKDLNKTLGEVARKYGETTERITDALETIKLLEALSESATPLPLLMVLDSSAPMTYILVGGSEGPRGH